MSKIRDAAVVSIAAVVAMAAVNEYIKHKKEKVKTMEDIRSINDKVQLKVVPYDQWKGNKQYDLDYILYDLDSQFDMLSGADSVDYIIAAASGILCGLLDILWTGDFDLASGRNIASDKVEEFVILAAKKLGGNNISDIRVAVVFLEKCAPMASDGNTNDFGGGLQHHLRDFAHHPTIVGMIFSILTQFTGKSYGTDVSGKFISVNVPESHLKHIGSTIGEKIMIGTFQWFIHLVSDVAGSSSSAGKGGGTGIPGPLLSLAKEMSVLPIFKNAKVADTELSVYLSKLFNGTALAQHDENERIIKESVLKIDLRGELGAKIELGKEFLPVIANEAIVRTFYFIRRLIGDMREKKVAALADMDKLDWARILSGKDPALARMLTVATGVFTTVDIGEAIATRSVVAVNVVGAVRFAVAIGQDVSAGLYSRNLKKLKSMYENISRNTYRQGKYVFESMMGLTLEQIEILYNIEYEKIRNDISSTSSLTDKKLKNEWLIEWEHYMQEGFASFTQVEGAQLRWLTKDDLRKQIEENKPEKPWYRLVLLEAMLFEPYYQLTLDLDSNGSLIPSKKFDALRLPGKGFNKSRGDNFLNADYTGKYCSEDYVSRLRKCYDKNIRSLRTDAKKVITTVSVGVVSAVAIALTAGIMAPEIAVLLVGSNFAGLSGAALTSASLAYLGGGAVAVGGAGMAGGTIAIVGGGATIGLGLGTSVTGAVNAAGLVGKDQTIAECAKMLVSFKEIFMNDEKDIDFANEVCDMYTDRIAEIEKGLIDLKLKTDIANGNEKKLLQSEIKRAKEVVPIMKKTRSTMLRFKSSFEEGMNADDENQS